MAAVARGQDLPRARARSAGNRRYAVDQRHHGPVARPAACGAAAESGSGRGLGNLDGGGSATCWVYGQVVNSPSEGRERPDGNSLVVVRKDKPAKRSAKPE